MARIPYITSNNRRDIVEFRGINYSKVTADGDLADCKNISLDKFPYITTAKNDTALSGTGYTGVKAMTAYKRLYTVADGTMYADGASVYVNIPAEKKQMAMMANGTMMLLPDEILIHPNRRSISGETLGVADVYKFYGQIETKGEKAEGSHYFLPKFQGEKTVSEINALAAYKSSQETQYKYYKVTDGGSVEYYTNAESETKGTIDVAAGQIIGIKYSLGYGGDYYRTATKVIFTGTELISDAHFEADKWAYISFPANSLNGTIQDISRFGLDFVDTGEKYSLTVSISSSGSQKLRFDSKCTGTDTYDDNMQNIAAKDDVILARHAGSDVVGKVTSVSNTSMTISGFDPETSKWYSFRRCEAPDFVCSWANRFWGCNSEKQLIFASELGNGYNYYTDEILASGSYQVAIGDSEFFTGCCEYGNSVLFFKQNRIHKIVGTSPKNYQLYTYECEGVKNGCYKSLCVINNILYYVGLHGVYAYSGGQPILISERLGNIEMNNACGGTDGDKYYLSFESGGKDYFFIYDPQYRIWILKDNIKIQDFARTEDNFYYLTDDTVHKASTGATGNNMEWHIQFTPFHETLEKKRYTKLLIRYELGAKSHMTVKVRIDGGLWNDEGKIVGGKGVKEIRLPVNRCDSIELRIEGKGEATIHEIAREFEIGSDV